MWLRIDLAYRYGQWAGVWIGTQQYVFLGYHTFVRFGALPPSRVAFPSASSSSSSAVRPPRASRHAPRSTTLDRSPFRSRFRFRFRFPFPPLAAALLAASRFAPAQHCFIKKAALDHGQSLSQATLSEILWIQTTPRYNPLPPSPGPLRSRLCEGPCPPAY